MRNLVSFLWRYQFTLLFLGLELIAMLLLVQANNYHRADFYNKLMGFSGSLYSSIESIQGYVGLKEENTRLAAENARLLSQQKSLLRPVKGYYQFVDDTLRMQQYQYTQAKVVKSTVGKRNNLFIIDKGSEQGVSENMGVTGPNGAVGVVRNVSDNFSAVLPILHSKSAISVKLKNQDYYGFVNWAGGNAEVAELKNIPIHVKIELGDSVVTRGSSGAFPSGVPVGTVIETDTIPGQGFFDIRIKLCSQFRKLSTVYIIDNVLREEQLKLEEETIEEDANAE